MARWMTLLTFLSMLGALSWGCSGSLTTPDDDDASDDDDADDDAGDDDAGDDDAGDDDAGDDDGGDDDGGDDDGGDDDTGNPGAYQGQLDLDIDFWGTVSECVGPMTAELDQGALWGVADCLGKVPYAGKVTLYFDLDAGVNGSDVQGILYMQDPTGGYIGDIPIDVLGDYDAGLGEIDAECSGEMYGVILGGSFSLAN
jgi:hypothetical protein